MSIARCITIVGSLYALMRQKLGLNVATPLGAQELSVTAAPDRRIVVLGTTPIAGFARDFGTVADEAAMLALHTLDSSTLLAEPTFVAPGDSCLRTDDPGWRWHCISGHGTTLADWERRPLAGALADVASGIAGAQPLDADLTAIAAQGVSAWGLARMADSGATATKAALSITRSDIGDASTAGRSLLAVTTPSGPKLVQVNADGSVSLVDASSGRGSSDTGASVYTTATQSIPATTSTKVVWHGEDHDDGDCADLTTYPTRLTVPAGYGGRYLLGYTVTWSVNGTGGRHAWLTVNGGTYRHAESSVNAQSNGGLTIHASTALLTLSGGDYVELSVFQASGGALNLHVESIGSRSCAFLRRVG